MGNGCDDEILADGQHVRLIRRRKWEYAQRRRVTGVVVIVAVTDDDRLVLIEQYREPVRRPVIELPAGLAGDAEGEEAERLEDAACRELLEETGHTAREMVPLTAGPPSAGLSDEIVTFFRATGLRKVADGGGVGRERITVHKVPLTEATAWLERAAARGALIDPKVYAGLYFVGPQL